MTLPSRVPDWEMCLARHIARYRDSPFEWGRFDCVIFAANGVRAMTGWDALWNLRGLYLDMSGARDLISRHGGIEAMARKVLGEPVAWGFARRGDPVLVEVRGAKALGLVDLSGERVALAGERGIARVRLSRSLIAWNL